MRFLAVVLALVACTKPPLAPTTPRGELPPPSPTAPNITWKRVLSPDDVPTDPPAAGAFRVHMIDVGTGLAILVQGHDFALLYDAGTNDRGEKPLRVVAYLERALGASGDELCGNADPTPRKPIPHVVLSHPHLDHASAMDLVVHCFDIAHLWDSGRVNDTVFYRELRAAIAKSTATIYHTAADVPQDRTQTVKGLATKIDTWTRFSEGDVVTLGDRAKFTLLHAEGKQLSDPNQNSVVIAVDLGATRLLLVGDAESGPRKDPSYPVGDVEEHLVERHAKLVRADILQVGHHGSMTSSRRGFLDAVKPRLALVSSGPKEYGGKTLPDAVVIEELVKVGATVLRTDEHDTSCELTARIGGDTGPGGCDSYIIEIE